MPIKSGILVAFAVMLETASLAQAQQGISERLMMDRLGDIQTGTFSASNGIRFTLDRYGDKYLLRVADDPEVFVLYADHASLGGRVLKYDSGGTAIQISGWGGLTIYTDAQPQGLPAERAGDSLQPALAPLSLSNMQNAAEDESEHLAYVRGVHLAFLTDWQALAADARLRAMAFDAMQNAARGIDRFCAAAVARLALAAHIDHVQIVAGGRPAVAVHGKTLLVTFDPTRGYAGRGSSHSVARALGQLLSIPTPG